MLESKRARQTDSPRVLRKQLVYLVKPDPLLRESVSVPQYLCGEYSARQSWLQDRPLADFAEQRFHEDSKLVQGKTKRLASF